LTLELVGEVDLETAPELDRQLDNVDQTPLEHLLIDLSGVSFMDSTGLRSIIRAQKVAESNGHTLAVRRGSRQVRRLFEVAGVDRRIIMED
jgi:anti-sigma B factor antagonist